MIILNPHFPNCLKMSFKLMAKISDSMTTIKGTEKERERKGKGNSPSPKEEGCVWERGKDNTLTG